MKYVKLLVCLLALLCAHRQVRAQPTWGERLGFAADQRVVILHADGLGLAYEVNRPVQELLEKGPLTSASVVTAGAWVTDTAQWCQEHPQADVGISLSFVSPSPALKWSCVAPREEVASLIDRDGYFANTVLQFHLRADLDSVRREAEAQIERARRLGIRPSHLHPHLGAMLTRPDLLRLYLELAREYWIPAVMVDFTPELITRFREAGFPLDDEMLEVIADYPLPKVDAIQSVGTAKTYEAKRRQLLDVVRDLQPGITQIFLKLSDDSPGMRRASTRWQDRIWEQRLLKDPEVTKSLKEQQITLTNWRELMERFEAAYNTKDP